MILQRYSNINWLDEMYGLDEYNSKARMYYPAIARTTTPDPLAEKYYSASPYAWAGNNTVNFIDPTGMDTVDIHKNDAEKWIITRTQIVEGNDIFRVNNGEETKTYTFSEGEYGKRVNILNVENNDDYTLGIYHISGVDDGRGSGYVVTPGGEASAKVGSNKRLPPDTYTLTGQPGSEWRQVGVVSGENVGNVSARGIRFHFGYNYPNGWTKGCFILSFDYQKDRNKIKYTETKTRGAIIWFDFKLGATQIYKYAFNKYNGHGRIGAIFPNNKIYHKLILKDAF